MAGKDLVLVQPKRRGRPCMYSAAVDEEICERLTEGESLRSICRDAHMPSVHSVFNWLRNNPVFLDHYREARARQAELMIDELLDISDDSRNDWTERESKSGNVYEVPDHEVIQRSKLRVETRKWIAANLLPKKYGRLIDGDGGSVADPVRIEGGLPD